MKTLVAFFSASGTTANIAKKLADVAGADLYEIKPEVKYSPLDLDWRNDKSRSSVEMKNRSSRPSIVKGDIDITPYDVIFVGFPIWWYVAPTIVNTFLESQDFSNKKIVLFATSGGSRFGKTVEGLKPSVSASAKIEEGRILNGNPSREELASWIENLKV